MTNDLESEILALRVSGVSEREICRRFGCTMERVRAVLDEHAVRKLVPENMLRILKGVDRGRRDRADLYAPSGGGGRR